MSESFKTFYYDLYTSEVIQDYSQGEDSFDQLTLEELSAALTSLNKGKSPGLDRLPQVLFFFTSFGMQLDLFS